MEGRCGWPPVPAPRSLGVSIIQSCPTCQEKADSTPAQRWEAGCPHMPRVHHS